MAELTESQLIERFTDGLAQARAAAKLLAIAQGTDQFIMIEQALGHVADKGRRLAQMKSASRPRVLAS